MTKFVTQAGWEDVPHLSPENRAELEESYQPHEREARTRGMIVIGSGAIFPVPESEITVAPFEIPKIWRHVYGMDVGWNRTAIAWGAYDEESDILYIYSEHYRSHAEPAVHAEAIRARGEWIPGVIDPASRGRSPQDGSQLISLYRKLRLNLTEADNKVTGEQGGLYVMWERLSSGRLKVFSTCQNWFGEYRIYRRDDKGKVVKTNDHLMDATRYVVMSGIPRAAFRPAEQWDRIPLFGRRARQQREWNPIDAMRERDGLRLA